MFNSFLCRINEGYILYSRNTMILIDDMADSCVVINACQQFGEVD